MQAALVDSPGGSFVLRAVARPVPRSGQALVRIMASGVSPLDTKIHAGQAAHARQPLPAVLGVDLAGVVTAVAADVTTIRVGDEVYGLTGGVGGLQGSLAEYAAVDVALLAVRSQTLGWRETAALPLNVITAWEGLVDRAGVRAGDRVLVHGGAGGVGHIVVQLARAYDAQVFATASARDHAYIAQLGATPIDRTAAVEDYVAQHTQGRGFDIVYDTLGGATLDASFQAVRRFGHVVSCLGWGTHALAPLSFRAATYSGVFTLLPLLSGDGRAHHGEILREATRLISAGKLIPRMDPKRFTLQSVGDAYQAFTAGDARGKLVIEIGSAG